VAICVFPFITKTRKNTLTQWWSGHILAAFNITLKTRGQIPGQQQQHVMFVANHISWVDIFAINSVLPVRFIAKSEIRHWPVIGFLATRANTLFIQREKRHHANRMNQQISHSLQLGDNLCLFPEGTTTNGHQVHPFKPSLFQAAIDAKTIVWPIAIRYLNTADGKTDMRMAYADDTSLLDSLKAILTIPQPNVEIFFLPPIGTSSITNRQMLANASREEMIKVLENGEQS